MAELGTMIASWYPNDATWHDATYHCVGGLPIPGREEHRTWGPWWKAMCALHALDTEHNAHFMKTQSVKKHIASVENMMMKSCEIQFLSFGWRWHIASMTSQSLIRRPRLQQGERVRGEITSSKGQEVITSSKEQEARSEEYKQSGNLAAGFVPDPSFSSIPYNTNPVQTCAANTNSSAYSHERLQPKGHRLVCEALQYVHPETLQTASQDSERCPLDGDSCQFHPISGWSPLISSGWINRPKNTAVLKGVEAWDGGWLKAGESPGAMMSLKSEPPLRR